MKRLILLLPLLFSSCASYIDQMHKSFDASDNRRSDFQQDGTRKKDQFSMYRDGARAFDNSPNTSTNPNLAPNVQRNYQPSSVVKRRYRAEDLNDNSNDASLWATDDDAQFLFTQATEKKVGEIILINVNTKLKKAITAELKRAFPDPIVLAPPKAADPAKPGDPAAAAPAPKPAPTPADPEDNSSPGTIHDRISSIIVEKINKNHLLLKGRKKLIYKKRNRTIEVQALISKKNITGEDAVNSDDILESTVKVVR